MAREGHWGPAYGATGRVSLTHPVNLGRDRTGACCAAWWAKWDRLCARLGPRQLPTEIPPAPPCTHGGGR